LGKPQPTSPNPLGPFPHLATAQPAAHALAQPRSRARPAPHFPDPTCQWQQQLTSRVLPSLADRATLRVSSFFPARLCSGHSAVKPRSFPPASGPPDPVGHTGQPHRSPSLLEASSPEPGITRSNGSVRFPRAEPSSPRFSLVSKSAARTPKTPSSSL